MQPVFIAANEHLYTVVQNIKGRIARPIARKFGRGLPIR